MRSILFLFVAGWLGGCIIAVGNRGPRAREPRGERPLAEARPDSGERREVEAVLDEWHRAASVADGDAYLGSLAPGAVFLGTAPEERWSVQEFRDYAEPWFSQGKGWTYLPQERHVYLSDDGELAWFDERLQNAKLGECRGSGALLWGDGRWRVSQYNLTVPIPNDLVVDVADKIRARAAKEPQ